MVHETVESFEMATSKNYTLFDPTNQLYSRIADLENGAVSSTVLSCVKFNPGGCVLPQVYDQYYDIIEEFPVEDTDVWVVSFLKAGSSWTQEMIWLLKNNYDYEGAKKRLIERVPFFE